MVSIELEIYDNGGESIDRYSVRLSDVVYAMSHSATSPQGVNQFAGLWKEMDVKNLGNEIQPLMLPTDVKRAIARRMSGYIKGLLGLDPSEEIG